MPIEPQIPSPPLADARPEVSYLIGRDSATLAAVEVGLGSLLHALHVPLAGNFLSLNQGAFLSYSLRRARGDLQFWQRRTFPFFVSQATALLKSLSPAGKRLTPMLAISAQGICFSAGVLILGPNLAGAVLGAALLSVWSILQAALIGWLLLGESALEIIEGILGRLQLDSSQLWTALIAWILLKALLAALLAATAWSFPDFWKRHVLSRSSAPVRLDPRSHATPLASEKSSPLWLEAARDLLRPLPLIAILAPVAFFAFSQKSWAQWVWLTLRPLALAYLGFVLLRSPRVRQWLQSRWARAHSS